MALSRSDLLRLLESLRSADGVELVHTVGIAPEDVAAMSLEAAVDRWTVFMSEPGRQ